MSKLTMFLSTLAMLSIAVVLSGCSTEGDSTPPATPADQGPADDEGSATKDEHAGHEHGDSDVQEAMVQLSEEDRAAAEKQKICPVTDELLGSMGKPIKVTIAGRDVFICCQMCEDALKEDPDKYLAKINN